jgi:hypothetical protein
MSSLGVVTHVLASAVADDGTVEIAYPTGATASSLYGSTGGDLTVNDGAYGVWEQGSSGFDVTALGASTITITNRSGITWPAGATIRVSFGTVPRNGSYNLTTGTADGQASKGRKLSQELTASGAIASDVDNVCLNHASVVIAATWTPTPGLKTITDTSASGTAAHTLTLGGGATFNGTNTVATLNAPAESLVVFFDENLAGTIVVNTGSVALSGP